jgi:hypothetical protein
MTEIPLPSASLTYFLANKNYIPELKTSQLLYSYNCVVYMDCGVGNMMGRNFSVSHFYGLDFGSFGKV